MLINLSKVDWTKLRQQKLHVNEILSHRLIGITDEQYDSLDGLVNLLDDIQDQAAEQLGEEQVFGKYDKNQGTYSQTTKRRKQ